MKWVLILSKRYRVCFVIVCSSVGVKFTDTWGQLVVLTTILGHKTCINTSDRFYKRPYLLSMLSLHKITIFQKRK